MISRIHSKLGTAGLVVAIVALVAALTGAAFAAGGLTGQQEKQVKKIAKKFAGKNGATGPQGPAGAPGGKGDTGAQGKQGNQGEPGEDGEDGIDGEDGACSEANPECVLPSGATETGAWGTGPQGRPSVTPISFNLQLADAPSGMHFVNEAGEELNEEAPPVFETPVNCLGTVQAPTAPAGELCLYAAIESEISFNIFGGLDQLFTTGASAFFSGGPGSFGVGTWAVTAE